GRQDPVAVVVAQLLQPCRQRRRGTGVGSTLERNSLHDLAEGHDTEEDCGRIYRTQPDAGLVAASARFGQDVRIDEVHQRATSRPVSRGRALMMSITSSGQGGPFRI